MLVVCRLAHLFTKPAFYKPLVALEDPLSGLHANTHLAQVRYIPLQVDASTLIPDLRQKLLYVEQGMRLLVPW